MRNIISPPDMTLTFDLSTWKPNLYVSRPRKICDLILVTLALIVTKILYSDGFLGHHLLWPWPLTPKSNQYICERNTYVTKIWWNSLLWVFSGGGTKIGEVIGVHLASSCCGN